MSNIKEIKVDYSSYEIVPDKLYDRFDQHIIYPPTNLSADDTLVTESNLTGYPSSTNYRGLSLAGDTPFVYIPNADSSTTGLMPYSQFNRLTAAYDAAVANPRVRSYTNISNSGMTLDCINIFDLWTTTRGSYSYARIALGEFSNYGSTNDSNCYSLLISGVVGYWGADSRMTFQGSIGTRSVYKLTATRAGTNLTGSIWFSISGSSLLYYTSADYTIAHLTIIAPTNYFTPNSSVSQYFTSTAYGTKLSW